jgi:hypothetical protein
MKPKQVKPDRCYYPECLQCCCERGALGNVECQIPAIESRRPLRQVIQALICGLLCGLLLVCIALTLLTLWPI